jgi:hypothetical protein
MIPHCFFFLRALDGEFPNGPVGDLLHLPDSLATFLVRSQFPTKGTGQLGSEVERLVLLALVESTKLALLGLIDNCEHTGNRFSDLLDLGQFRRGTTSNLLHTKRGKFGLQFFELFEKLSFLFCPKLVCLDFRHFCWRRMRCVSKNPRRRRRRGNGRRPTEGIGMEKKKEGGAKKQNQLRRQ